MKKIIYVLFFLLLNFNFIIFAAENYTIMRGKTASGEQRTVIVNDSGYLYTSGIALVDTSGLASATQMALLISTNTDSNGQIKAAITLLDTHNTDSNGQILSGINLLRTTNTDSNGLILSAILTKYLSAITDTTNAVLSEITRDNIISPYTGLGKNIDVSAYLIGRAIDDTPSAAWRPIVCDTEGYLFARAIADVDTSGLASSAQMTLLISTNTDSNGQIKTAVNTLQTTNTDSNGLILTAINSLNINNTDSNGLIYEKLNTQLDTTFSTIANKLQSLITKFLTQATDTVNVVNNGTRTWTLNHTTDTVNIKIIDLYNAGDTSGSATITNTTTVTTIDLGTRYNDITVTCDSGIIIFTADASTTAGLRRITNQDFYKKDSQYIYCIKDVSAGTTIISWYAQRK